VFNDNDTWALLSLNSNDVSVSTIDDDNGTKWLIYDTKNKRRYIVKKLPKKMLGVYAPHYIERIGYRLRGLKEQELFPLLPISDQALDELSDKFDAAADNLDSIKLSSPGELRIYDSSTRLTGLLNGEVMQEIPNSIYDESNEAVTILFPSDSCYYQVLGMAEGSYGLDAISIRNGEAILLNCMDIPTSNGAIHRYSVDWEALSQGQEGVNVEIDFDGDGTFELAITTGDSFLSTTATIDFDPDTLNLTSAGKWGTCYIELPEGYSVGEVAPGTVRLWIGSNSVLAEDKPFTVGDYDVDGIPDLMVKFSRGAIIGYLKGAGVSTGDATLTVNGQVGSSMFEGTVTIRIVESTDGTIDEGMAPDRPTEFALLQNFSNPFNPDTWIPYQLAEDVDVNIRIYDVSGKLVRTLDLGHKPVGFYTDKSKAAYWDGKNEAGEQVSSGIYFYIIQAGEFTTTRKMTLAK
jgi:flagellar hook capping protein FlgD